MTGRFAPRFPRGGTSVWPTIRPERINECISLKSPVETPGTNRFRQADSPVPKLLSRLHGAVG